MGFIKILERTGLGALCGLVVGAAGIFLTEHTLTVGNIAYGIMVGLIVGLVLATIAETEIR